MPKTMDSTYDGILDINYENYSVVLADAQKAGISAVIHKATEGVTWQDSAFWKRRFQAKTLGMLLGRLSLLQRTPACRPGEGLPRLHRVRDASR